MKIRTARGDVLSVSVTGAHSASSYGRAVLLLDGEIVDADSLLGATVVEATAAEIQDLLGTPYAYVPVPAPGL